ncbi:hypothetical protein GNF51_14700 [Clostridium perfringens]|uniref:hypothetical protein n=1 Tax=Clostridium perfringens TaxID=1502 RepID=UPI002AC583A3|nr:hypothetical protein [Clostridium perfringens]MDZ4957025.1 hypothetical protein [Clostridium perfringens]
MEYNEKDYKDKIKILKAENDLKKYIKNARKAILNKEYSKAKLYLKEALVMDSSNAEIENLLGVIEESLGNQRSAQNYYRVALVFDSTYAPAENNLKRLSLDNSGIYSIDLGE